MNIETLRELQKKHWEHHPPRRVPNFSYGHSSEVGIIPKATVEEIFALIEEHKLVCELTSVGFGFGGIGINICLDEQYPGVGVEFLFCLSQNHLDPEEYLGINKPEKPGDVSDMAWDLFKIARTSRNISRLKTLGFLAHDRQYFEY